MGTETVFVCQLCGEPAEFITRNSGYFSCLVHASDSDLRLFTPPTQDDKDRVIAALRAELEAAQKHIKYLKAELECLHEEIRTPGAGE